MNFLAHAFLSFGYPEILVGNMISDFVKGKEKFTFSPGIQKGIELHRAIDTFTDNHAATRAAKEFFRPAYRLYAGAFIDVAYDHFLANDTSQFPNASALRKFSSQVYITLNQYADQLPERFKNILPHMQLHDWLFNYRSIDGMMHSFGGLVRRAKYLNDSSAAIVVFEENYHDLSKYYSVFFPDLKLFAAHHLDRYESFL